LASDLILLFPQTVHLLPRLLLSLLQVGQAVGQTLQRLPGLVHPVFRFLGVLTRQGGRRLFRLLQGGLSFALGLRALGCARHRLGGRAQRLLLALQRPQTFGQRRLLLLALLLGALAQAFFQAGQLTGRLTRIAGQLLGLVQFVGQALHVPGGLILLLERFLGITLFQRLGGFARLLGFEGLGLRGPGRLLGL